MIRLGSTQPHEEEKNWQRQLDRFVKAHQQELAALVWGLWLENGDSRGTLGLDLEPTPHFVYCPKEAIHTLNNQVENKLQEILGVVDAHKPELEVLIVVIAKGQIKLIHFEPVPPPPACFEQIAASVDTLVERLEQRLGEQIEE